MLTILYRTVLLAFYDYFKKGPFQDYEKNGKREFSILY